MSHITSAIAFITSDVPDSQTLIDGIHQGIEVSILDPNRNAVAQIAETLKGKQYSAIHIISHGAPGHLQLGNTALNIETLPQYTQQIQQWRASLTADASILLYGCSVAATVGAGSPKYLTILDKLNKPAPTPREANQFLHRLHQLTGAKIAANAHPTGNWANGGNWEIQQLIPPSPTPPKLPFTESALKTYSGILGFAPKVDFATANLPTLVSIDDINGDGKPDLATANRGSASTSILLNTTTTLATTPTFATKVDFTTGTTPVSVSIGDINGDDKPDLATANYGSTNTSILLNTTTTGATTPTFATKVDFPTLIQPNSVGIGDFNGDGKPDLAVASLNNTTSIFLNTTTTLATTPTFATKVDFTTGPRPTILSIGDFNGDGKPDFATANQNNNTTSILLNTTTTLATTPTFATKVDLIGGTTARSVSIGDFNGDGKPDLAVANFGSASTSIFLNTTTTLATTPTFATKFDFTTGNGPASVSIGDFNRDGKPDLAVANFGSASTSIFLNTTPTGATTPTFATKIDFTTGTNPISVSIDDFNGDGKPDLAVANQGSNTTSIFLNNTAKVSIAAVTNPTETGLTNGTFNITLDTPAPAGGIVVNFDTTGSTAATPGHYSFASTSTNITNVTANTFTIAAGASTAVLNVVPFDDAIINPGETVKVNLTADTGFNYFLDPVAANTTATLTITDNDFPTVNLSVSPVTSTETGSPVITVTATASQAVVGDQTVNVALSGTAIPADFTTIPASITIPAGQTTGSFTVNVNDDALIEGSETGTFTISTPSSGITLGTTTTGDVAITDNDFPTVNLSVSPVTSTETGSPVITVTATASQAVVGDKTVNVALSGTAIAADFIGTIPTSITIPNGQTTGSFTVNVNDDALVEGSETGTFTISTSSSGITLGTTTTGNVAITDNDVTPLPEIQVLDGITDIADGTTSAIDFGSAIIGATLNKTFTVNNLGTAVLNLSNLTLPTGFSLVGTLPATVAAGGSANLLLQVDTTVAGNKTGTLQFVNNDSDENPFDFPISASVTTTALPEIQVLDGTTDIADGTTSAIDFGSALIGGTLNKT
ncbi:FG-GAP-like repeat-containing protein, partial [Microcoleus sp. A003_D6]|uniref:FG-GAP-like repeat-containing protein n=1 Tax=Microcoleus sp. A003_D6 TaxID=3055266 RepID=UPI002FD3F97C